MDQDYDAINYLDDFIGAEKWSKAFQSFSDLGMVLEHAGIVESLEKACPPNVEMVGLGVLFNTLSMTVSISQDRLSEIIVLVNSWVGKQTANLKEVQSLLGKLSFVAACVRPARIFLSRMFAVISKFPKNRRIAISEEFRKDLFWWQNFMPLYNGVSMMCPDQWSRPDGIFASDACLTGCGAWIPDTRDYFHMEFPQFILDIEGIHINALEFLAVIVSCKVWGDQWSGSRILIQCDNEPTVSVINNQKAGDPFMQSCLRELFFICAKYDFEVRAIHIPGVSNRIPDFLSRFHLAKRFRDAFYQSVGSGCEECEVPVHFFEFTFQW